jgi:hypothetical protein
VATAAAFAGMKVRVAPAAALAEMRVLVALTRTLRVACVPVRLAGSVMAGLREAIPSGGSPVLEAFTAGASDVAEAPTVAGVGDSSYEERKP